MIPPISLSIILNHSANLSAAVSALASKNEVLPHHFRRLQDNRNRRDALPTVDVIENLLLRPLRDSLPSPCRLRRERIGWMIGHYHLVFSSNARPQRHRSAVR
jgi:hypothetical protein